MFCGWTGKVAVGNSKLSLTEIPQSEGGTLLHNASQGSFGVEVRRASIVEGAVNYSSLEFVALFPKAFDDIFFVPLNRPASKAQGEGITEIKLRSSLVPIL